MPLPIAFAASQSHYLDHLAGVARLYDNPRIHVSRPVAPLAATLTRNVIRPLRPPPRTKHLVVVAAFSDLVNTGPHPAVLFEHGSGQAYLGQTSGSYAGGPGRERVAGFACVNEMVRDLNQRAYPNIPCEVVGSPYLDDLTAIPRTPHSTPTACIAFHWSPRHAHLPPEMGSALPHYAPYLATVKAKLAVEGIMLIGHHHPRAPEVAMTFEAAGIRTLKSFEQVIAEVDVLLVDNSSIGFLFAALDRPVIWLNSPAYRRDVEHGMRFWSSAALCGPFIDNPSDIPSTVISTLSDPSSHQSGREKVTAELFPYRGEAADRSKAFIDGVNLTL